MALAFKYHVVGDLTVGKPELIEFHDTETLNSAIQAIADSPEGNIPIWKKTISSSSSSSSSHANAIEDTEMRQNRFVGILSSLDIAAFLANTTTHNESLDMDKKLMNTPVSDVVVPNNSLLRIVDPKTRLIDALDMMKEGAKRLLVPKSLVILKGVSKRFLKNIEACSDSTNNIIDPNMNVPCSSSSSFSSTASNPDKFCCLSREDVLRFIIGCLGALAPLPLTSMAALGAINSQYSSIESSNPAIEAAQKAPQDPSAVAVVESTPEGKHKIIGEISAHKLWKCDYLAAAWALANLSAGRFVMGVEDNDTSGSNSRSLVPDLSANSSANGATDLVNGVGTRRPKKFSSRSIGFFSNHAGPNFGRNRSKYRGRSAPLTCKVTSTLAAVMAQMLSHRATHVWVTEDEGDDVVVGFVGYADILAAVTKHPSTFVSANRSAERLGNEIQS